uniref:POPLD domain-containing protein n=1 Tax=Ascaris lumbricoides TaxID=6252 RepID=A0A0M3HEV5_ASCLU
MANVFDSLPDVLLTIMGLLGLVRAVPCQDAFAAAAALFGVDMAELYREVEQFLQDHWKEDLAALDVHSLGLQYFVGEAAGCRPHPLLLEAACRLKRAQLSIWDVEGRSCELYGHSGPIYAAAVAVEGGQFIALTGQSLVPWYKNVARELEPGTSYGGRDEARIIFPVPTEPEEVLQESVARPHPDEVKATQKRRSVEEMEREAADRSERAQWQDALAARYRDMLRPRTVANASAERMPRRRATRQQPEFRPADISALPAHMASELVAPSTPPYIVQNNKILCRLPHCEVQDREFETVAAWRKHVALARSHLEDAFCGTCGHHLVVPPEADAATTKAFMAAHKKERCVGAPKAILQQRRAHVMWLNSLRRSTSHILLPDATVEPERQSPTVGRKRHHDSEEARRADICAAYLKRHVLLRISLNLHHVLLSIRRGTCLREFVVVPSRTGFGVNIFSSSSPLP